MSITYRLAGEPASWVVVTALVAITLVAFLKAGFIVGLLK